MPNASDHLEVVQSYLQAKLDKGTLLGPIDCSMLPHVHVSKFGIIPKPHQPGKWYLIVDLSAPTCQSVNDGIPSELCYLSYGRMDQMIERTLQLGTGINMANFDIKSAYRIVPVHPHDRYLLGMEWNSHLYLDAALPFGLRSAPIVFTSVADALEWIFR